MSNVGWIKLHRKILNWEWYQDANTYRIYIHLLLTACYEPKKWMGKDINKGDCVFSIATLSEQLNLSVQQIRTSLQKLKSTNNITIKSTNRYHIVNITKYDSFIGENLNEKNINPLIQQTKQQEEQQTNNKQITSSKEINNLNNNIYNNNLKNNNSNELLQKERGTRFDVNQQLPQSWREYAVEQGVEGIDNEFERFKNYWTSPNAKKPLKKDWTATWRNWILKNANKNNYGWQQEASKNSNKSSTKEMSIDELFEARGL